MYVRIYFYDVDLNTMPVGLCIVATILVSEPAEKMYLQELRI